MKTCTKCKILKEKTEFHKSGQTKDGLRSWCKLCLNKDSKAREPRYKGKRKQYLENTKEQRKQHKREFYSINRDKILSDNKAWRQTNTGRMHIYKRGAIKRGIKWMLSYEEFMEFWQKPCNYCGSLIDTIGIDRIDSLKDYSLDNIVPCCYQCNIMKLDYIQDEFLQKIKQIYELQRGKGRFN